MSLITLAICVYHNPESLQTPVCILCIVLIIKRYLLSSLVLLASSIYKSVLLMMVINAFLLLRNMMCIHILFLCLTLTNQPVVLKLFQTIFFPYSMRKRKVVQSDSKSYLWKGTALKGEMSCNGCSLPLLPEKKSLWSLPNKNG